MSNNAYYMMASVEELVAAIECGHNIDDILEERFCMTEEEFLDEYNEVWK